MLAFNDKRRSTQNQLDKNLAEVNSLSKSIGQLMKEGKKEDAETAKARVAEIKEPITIKTRFVSINDLPFKTKKRTYSRHA